MNKEEIKKYFNHLSKKFIRLNEYCKIKFDFRENLDKFKGDDDNGEVYGNVNYSVSWYERWFLFFKWWSWTSYPYTTYTVYLLNHYPFTDLWRLTAVHEFTHVYLFHNRLLKNKNKIVSKKEVDHEHDDNFYAKMDYFEAWIDKELNLPPRKDKGGDWLQHINPLKREERQLRYSKRLEVELETKKYEADGFSVFREPVVYMPSKIDEAYNNKYLKKCQKK